MASSLTVDLDGSADEVRPTQRPVRPRRRKLRERISLGHLFMIASALLAFVLVVSVLQDRTATTTIVVADADILPGTIITGDLVRQIEIPADSPLVGSVATLATIASGELSVGHRIGAGDPITLTGISPASSPSALRAMSVPIDRADAVGGDLTAGDRVDVISVAGGAASYVAVDLEVLGTQGAESRTGALGSSSLSNYFVTVSVDDQNALAIALAMETGKVSIVRSTGAVPVPPEQRRLAAELTPSLGGGLGDTAGAGGDG